MQYTIKLFAEITIKSKPVRQRLVRMLRDKDGRERIAGDTLLSLDTLGRVTGWGATSSA